MDGICTVYCVIITALTLAKSINAVDPLEGVIRGFVYTTKDTVEKFLRQVKTPRIVPNPNGGISFQFDPEEQEASYRLTLQCPLCRQIDREAVVGAWDMVIYSRNFLLTTLTDVNRVIDRLQSNLPIYTQKTLYEWVVDPPALRCPQITVLDASDHSKFELRYQLANGSNKSIIGVWERTVDGAYFLQIGPTISLELCVAFAHVPNVTSNNATALQFDFIVFNQIDSWPKCDNFIALVRSADSAAVNNLREFLEQQKIESAFNKLEKAQCDRIINNSQQRELPYPV